MRHFLTKTAAAVPQWPGGEDLKSCPLRPLIPSPKRTKQKRYNKKQFQRHDFKLIVLIVNRLPDIKWYIPKMPLTFNYRFIVSGSVSQRWKCLKLSCELVKKEDSQLRPPKILL